MSIFIHPNHIYCCYARHYIVIICISTGLIVLIWNVNQKKFWFHKVPVQVSGK